MNKIQDELELVFPTPEYKTQVEEYLQELIMESMKLQEMVDQTELKILKNGY